MRLAWVCALKDLRRLRRDPVQLAVWIGVPAFAAVLMMLVFGRGQVTPKGTLLVADEDASFVSSLLTGAFTQGPLGDMLTVEKVSLAEGQKRIQRGRASALLHVPKGFGEAVLAGTPSRLKLVTNPSQAILPEIVAETVSLLLEAGFYVQALAGERLKELTRGQAPSELQVVEAAVAFNRLGAAVGGYLDPRRIDLVTEVVETRTADASRIPAALLRSMMFMAVLFLAMGFSTEIWKERRQGALRRLLAGPAPPAGFLLGRVLAMAAVLAAVAACGLVAGSAVLQVSPARLLFGILFMTLAGAGLYLLFQVAVMFASTERTASILANLLMFPLAMIGGSFFPFEFMPGWMTSIGRLTPNGWALTQLGLLLEGRTGASQIGLAFGCTALFAGAMFWVAVQRLRRGFAL